MGVWFIYLYLLLIWIYQRYITFWLAFSESLFSSTPIQTEGFFIGKFDFLCYMSGRGCICPFYNRGMTSFATFQCLSLTQLKMPLFLVDEKVLYPFRVNVILYSKCVFFSFQTAMACAEVSECPLCWLCCEIYDDQNFLPRLLSCGHTFCSSCLENLLKNNSISCPECRTTASVPVGFVGLTKKLCIIKNR